MRLRSNYEDRNHPLLCRILTLENKHVALRLIDLAIQNTGAPKANCKMVRP